MALSYLVLFRALPGLSEDPEPHAVFFSCVRRAGRGVGLSRVTVVVGSPKIFQICKKNNDFQRVGQSY